MPVQTVYLADGSTETLNIPPGSTKEDIARLINRKRASERGSGRLFDFGTEERKKQLEQELRQARFDLAGTRETSIAEDLTSGFGAGFVGTGETATLGLASLLEEEEELAARNKIKSFFGDITPEGGDPDSITYGLGQALGSIAGIAAPVAAAAKLPFTGAALGTGAVLTGALGAGEASERAREEDATEAERSKARNLGILVGFTEILPISRFVKLVDMPALNKLADTFGPQTVNTLGERVRRAAGTAGFEGAQEVVAEFFQNAIESGYNIDQDLAEGLAPAAGYGAGAGAIVQAVVDLFTKGRRIGDKTPEQIEQEAPNLAKTTGQIIDTGDLDAAGNLNDISAEELSRAVSEVTGETGEGEQAQSRLAQEEITEIQKRSLQEAREKREAQPRAADVTQDRETQKQRLTQRITEEATQDPKVAEEIESLGVANFIKKKQQELGADRFFRVYLSEEGDVAPRDERVTRGTDVESAPINRDVLETLGLTPTSAIGKSLLGRDLTREGPRTELQTYAADAEPEIKQNIADTLERTPLREGLPDDVIISVPGKIAKGVTDKQLKEADLKKLRPREFKKWFDSAKKGGEKRIAENKSKELRNLVGDDPFTAQDNDKILELVKSPRPSSGTTEASSNRAAAQVFLGKMARPVDSMYLAISDVATENISPQDAEINQLREDRDAADKAKDTKKKAQLNKRIEKLTRKPTTDLGRFLEGTGATQGAKVIEWARENLSPEAVNWITNTQNELGVREEKLQKYVKSTSESVLGAVSAPTGTDVEVFTGGRATPAQLRAGKVETRERFGAAGPARDVPLEEYQAEREQKLFDAVKKYGDIGKGLLSIPDMLTFRTPLDPKAEAAARGGDLKGALDSIVSTVTDPKLRKAASVLRDYVTDTRVQVVSTEQLTGLTDRIFRRDKETQEALKKSPAAALYIPATDKAPALSDTIFLDENGGLATVTLLHEVTHAATLKELSNKNSPLTKEITKLYKRAKEELPDLEGTRDVFEFVAEAFTNPVFQQKLALLPVVKDTRSSFQKFIDVIRRFLFGFQPNKESILDRTDTIIAKILTPSRASLDEVGPVLSMAVTNGTVESLVKGASKASRIAAKAQQAQPKQELYDSVMDAMYSLPKAGGFAAFFGMNSRMMAQVGTGIFNLPQFEQLHKLIGNQEGEIKRQTDMVKATAKRLGEWEKANPDLVATFNDLINLSTIKGVDLRKPESEYKDDADKLKFYKENKSLLERLPGVKTQYNEVFTLYSKILETMQENLQSHVNEFVEDANTKKTLSNLIDEKLFARATIDPYSPLTREGNYWLQYNVGTDVEPVYQTFGSDGARKRFIEALKQEPDVEETSIKPFQNVNKFDFDALPPKSWIAQLITALQTPRADGSTVDPQVINQVMQLYIESVPESSFAKSLQTRKNREGYQSSVLQGMNIRAFDMARQAVNTKYTREIYKLKRELKEELRTRVVKANELQGLPANHPLIKEYERQYGPIDYKLGKVNVKRFSETTESLLNGTFAWRAEQSTNPTRNMFESLAVGANQLTFTGIMGVNASSAILQTAGLPMILLPFLAGKTSFSRAFTDMTAATKLFSGSGLSRQVRTAAGEITDIKEAYIGAPSIDNYYEVGENGEYIGIKKGLKLNDDPNNPFYVRTGKDGKPTVSLTQKQFVEDVQDVIKEADDRGLLNRTIHGEMIGLDISGQKDVKRSAQAWKDFNTLMSYPFQMGDRMQRQVTLISAYLTETDRLTNSPNRSKGEQNLTQEEIKQRAIQAAISDTEQTGGTNLLGQAAPIAQRNVGRVMMMFKSYGLTVYYHQIKLMADYIDARHRGDEQAKRIARNQVAGTLAATAAMSGVAGLTLYGAVVGLLDLFLTEDDEETYDAFFRKNLGEGFYKGGVNYVMAQLGVPIDVSPRIGLANLIISSNRYNFDRSVEESIVDALGGAAWSTARRVQRGIEKIGEGEYQRGIEDVLPVSMSNMLKAGRYASEGALTRRGDPITTDFNTGTIAAKFFGFAPAEYTKAQEIAQDVKRIDKAVNRQRSALLKKMYIMNRQGDIQGLIDVRREISEFNRKHARLGPKVPITEETIKRSMAQHMRTSEQMFNGVQLSPNVRDALKLFADAYDRGPAFL